MEFAGATTVRASEEVELKPVQGCASGLTYDDKRSGEDPYGYRDGQYLLPSFSFEQIDISSGS